MVAAAFISGLISKEGAGQILPVTPHELLPEQKIVIESENIPPWKALWDEARQSAIRGDFDKAQRQYQALLVLKSNLEEARWELARILMYRKQWQDAAQLLELLLESVPDSAAYHNALGKVMLEMEQYERAVGLFQKVYEKNKSDRTALAGLVEGLIKLERKTEALPFLEQLAWQDPTNRGIRRYLASLLFETGHYEKARAHFTILARNEDVGLDVLRQTAKTYEILGMGQEAATYWERVQGRDPGDTAAHEFLARYYTENGQWDRALHHLEKILVSEPGNLEIYFRLGQTAQKTGKNDLALSYYRKFLEEHPEDKRVLQSVANLTEAPGETVKAERKKTGATLPASSAESKQQTDLPAATGKLLAAGSYQKLLQLYRELIKTRNRDQGLPALLARDLAVIREKRGLDAMIEFLAEAAENDLAIYRGLAENFRETAHEDEMLAVLNIIHQKDPADNFTTQELAILYLNRGDLVQSHKYFEELRDEDCWNIRCLEARASFAERFSLPAHSLRDYESLLELQPDRSELRLKSVRLAAQLGLIDKALFHAGYLQNVAGSYGDNELKILLADTYRISGYETRAINRYQSIIDQTGGMDESDIQQVRIRSWFGMVAAYKKLELPYEAEQILRSALVEEKNRLPYLAALFHLYLETGRIAESDVWLQAIRSTLDETVRENDKSTDRVWLMNFFEAESYAAAGEHDLALELYRQAESMAPEEQHQYPLPFLGPELRDIRLRILSKTVTSLLHTGDYGKAESMLLALKKDHDPKPEALVLLEKVYLEWEKRAQAEKTSREIREFGASDLGRELILAGLYRQYGNIGGQAELAEKAVDRETQSLAAKYLLADALLKQKKYQAGRILLQEYLKEYPENTWFLSKQAEVLARLGNFEEAVAATDMILSENPSRIDIVLLRSRVLWEMNRWKDSVAQYESVLEPAVEELLEQKITDLELAVGHAPARNPWWQALTFSKEAPVRITEVLMPPKQAVRISDEDLQVNGIAAEYYALYRWQERLVMELSVRRSVMRREYYHAANRLEQLIDKFGSNDFLLYDLAGLYSKLERLGDEAIVYRKIAEHNTDFPGLKEAVQRNSLKRRPQAALAYQVKEEDGWDGYKAIRQETVKGNWKYYQSTNQQWNFEIARNFYESTNDAQSINSWRTMVSYGHKLSHSLDLSFGGGVERIDKIYDDTPLFFGSVTGKIADEMRAVFSIRQDVVTDTIASLKRNIKQRDYKIEVMFDLFPRLLLGGYFDFVNFSDSNWTNNYTFWASYILLPEPTLIKINYNYDLHDSREGKKPGPPLEDGFGFTDHPYWSPVDYWVTRFSVNLKHQLSNDALARGVPSYYTVEYSLGYDSDDNDLHELKGSFNFEIAENYTISASFNYYDLGVYQQEELKLSVMYRF